MASPLDTATAIAKRKKQLLGAPAPAGGAPATPGPTTPPGFKFTPMSTPAAQALGRATLSADAPSTTPPGFKFTPMVTPAARALGQAVLNPASTTPEGFKFTPMVTAAAQALGEATMGADNRVFSATASPATTPAVGRPAPAAAATSTPRSTGIVPESGGGFDYSGMTRSRDQMGDEARARAAMQIDTRAQALKDALVRTRAAAEDQRKGQMTNLAGMEEGNRYRFAGSNLGTSGFMAGANAVAQGRTQDNIGQIDQGEQQAIEATNNQLGELERLRGSVETATLADLERMNNDVQFKGADLASVLANRSFELQRGKSLLGGELTAQELANQGLDLGNQGASLGLERGRGLLPYELGNAAVGYQRNSGLLPYDLGNAATSYQRNQGLLPYDLGNAATNYQRNSQMLPLDVQQAQLGVDRAGIGNRREALQLDTETKMQPFTLEGARLGNERAAQVNRMAELEYTIANDPDVGKRAQAQVDMQQARKQLEVMDAQIKQTTAKALTGGSSGSGGSFTAWQQYQILRDEKGDDDKGAEAKGKARDKLVDSFRDDYNISQSGADLWADFMEIATTPKADGTMGNRLELGQLLGDMMNDPSVPMFDKGWVGSMFWAGQGEQWAQEELNSSKYRKKPITTVQGTKKPPAD